MTLRQGPSDDAVHLLDLLNLTVHWTTRADRNDGTPSEQAWSRSVARIDALHRPIRGVEIRTLDQTSKSGPDQPDGLADA